MYVSTYIDTYIKEVESRSGSALSFFKDLFDTSKNKW